VVPTRIQNRSASNVENFQLEGLQAWLAVFIVEYLQQHTPEMFAVTTERRLIDGSMRKDADEHGEWKSTRALPTLEGCFKPSRAQNRKGRESAFEETRNHQ
jgi:hypothetical protein